MNRYNIILYCLVCIIFSSCGGMNDNIEQYLERGEDIYAGKLDSVTARGGLNKIQIEGLTTFSHMTIKCIVRWEEQEREYAMEEVVKNDTVKILLTDLPEGSYNLLIQTEDKEGNRSIPVDCIGVSYGDRYKSTQIRKNIVSMDLTPARLLLNWNLSELAVKVNLSYENTDGEIIRRELPGDVSQTEIVDWKIGGIVEAITYVLPSPTALEAFDLEPLVKYFPDEVKYEVDKSMFKKVSLQTDTKGDAWGGKIEGIWDGVKEGESSRYHSNPGDGAPHHFTFDIGVMAHLTKVELVGRADYLNWNPKRIQLWGVESLDGAETTLSSSDPGWEKESLEKGWQLLADEYTIDPVTNVFELTKPVKGNIRYIRYRALEVNGSDGVTTGSGVYGVLQELTLWANDIKYIESD